jgi:hypothetical protein
MLWASSVGSPRLSDVIRLRTRADSRNRPAVAAKTAPTLVSVSRMPPSAGPTKKPRLSRLVEVAFAAVSSSGDRARVGRRADWAGPNAVLDKAVRTASA